MSSSSSPALVLELPRTWRRLIPAGTLMVTALLLPVLAVAWHPAALALVMLGGLSLAALAGWQAGIGGAARRLIRVTWAQSCEWRLQFATGEPVLARLDAGSWCAPGVMCWRFVDATGRRHGLLVWRSEFSGGDWHQWRLRLRLEGARAAAPVVEPLR